MKTQFPLQFYVDMLKTGEKFSLARYGDGELYCMWGKQGHNCDGTKYSPALRRALLDSLRHYDDPTFIYGLQHVLPRDEKRVMEIYPDIDWYDSEIFSEALMAGKLYPLIEQLNKMNVCIVGNESIRPIKSFLHYEEFVEVSPSNAFGSDWSVVDMGENNVVLFSCGMAANTFISELHGKYNGWLIDVGHIWDPFVGKRSRGYLETLSDEDINKNLCP